jgi:glutaredoxin
MFFKVIRKVLGSLILAGDKVSQPTPIQRSAADQNRVDSEVSNLSLYQFHACPFCVKTRRAIRKLNLPITLIDAKIEPAKTTLKNQGGKVQVPCLRIEKDNAIEWMYESNAIIDYLQQRFNVSQ